MQILLVDDQQLVREGIRALLALNEELEVVAEAWDGEDAMEKIRRYTPDLILLDIRMPRMDGLALLTELKRCEISIPTLVLTTFDDHELVLACIKQGARGYLRKDTSLDEPVDAIHAVSTGKQWVNPAANVRISQSLPGSDFDNYSANVRLTEIEQQVLRLVAAGYSNREIAGALYKSEGTIRNQISFVLNKLNVRDRTRAVLKALDLGLI